MEVKQILKQSEGSTVIDIGVWVLVILIIFSVVFEYIRVQLIAYNLKDTFENAVKTVVSENYNEVYAGFRESITVGGQYEGGPEGANNDEEEPEWVDLNDYGDVEQEVTELLCIESLETGDGSYSIQDVEIKVQNGDESESGKYEINGSMNVTVPIRIIDVTVEASIPIKVKSIYNEMY